MPKREPDPNWDAASRVIRAAAKVLWPVTGTSTTPKHRTIVRKPPRESARRRKMFHVAERTLHTMARVHGSLVTYVWDAGMNRSGLRWGLGIHLDPDHDLMWSPRGGYRVVGVVEIPF